MGLNDCIQDNYCSLLQLRSYRVFFKCPPNRIYWNVIGCLAVFFLVLKCGEGGCCAIKVCKIHQLPKKRLKNLMRADFASTNKNHLDQSLWRAVAVDKERTDMISKRMIKVTKIIFTDFKRWTSDIFMSPKTGRVLILILAMKIVQSLLRKPQSKLKLRFSIISYPWPCPSICF